MAVMQCVYYFTVFKLTNILMEILFLHRVNYLRFSCCFIELIKRFKHGLGSSLLRYIKVPLCPSLNPKFSNKSVLGKVTYNKRKKLQTNETAQNQTLLLITHDVLVVVTL